MRKLPKFRDDLMERLKDSEFATAFLEATLEEYETDRDIGALLQSLRDIADAQGGMSQLAERTQLNRQHLYSALSPNGNPRIETLEAIVNALGFRISFTPLKRPKRTRKQQPAQAM